MEPAADLTGTASGYQAGAAVSDMGSSSGVTGAGPGDQSSTQEDRGSASSSRDPGDTGDPAGAARRDDSLDPRVGIAAGKNSPEGNSRGQGSVSQQGGTGDSPSPVGGGRSGSGQGLGALPDLDRPVSHAPGTSGSSGKGQRLSPEPEDRSQTPGRNDVQSFTGILAVTAGMSVPGWGGGAGAASPGQSQHGPGPHPQQGMPAQAGQYPCGPAETSPVIPGQGRVQSGDREETRSQPRPKRPKFLPEETGPVLPATRSPALPPVPLSPFGLLLFGGYRRISKKNVLLQGTRNIVYQAVIGNPGIDVPTLVRMTGVNENTLRYHLGKLLATGNVTSLIRPGVIRYFLNRGAYNLPEQILIHYLWNETPRGILHLIRCTPGLTRQQISDALGISGPSVTRQMEHLLEDRIIENRFPGRSNHYYLTDETARIFELLGPHTAGRGRSERSRQLVPAGLGGSVREHPVVYSSGT